MWSYVLSLSCLCSKSARDYETETGKRRAGGVRTKLTFLSPISVFPIAVAVWNLWNFHSGHLEQTVLKLNLDPNTTFCQMNPFRQFFMTLFEWICVWLKYGLMRLCGAFPIVNTWITSPGITDCAPCQTDSDKWKTSEALRTYNLADGGEAVVTVQTSLCAFHVSKTSV